MLHVTRFYPSSIRNILGADRKYLLCLNAVLVPSKLNYGSAVSDQSSPGLFLWASGSLWEFSVPPLKWAWRGMPMWCPFIFVSKDHLFRFSETWNSHHLSYDSYNILSKQQYWPFAEIVCGYLTQLQIPLQRVLSYSHDCHLSPWLYPARFICFFLLSMTKWCWSLFSFFRPHPYSPSLFVCLHV